jgi:dTDP-4-dehydrorhamnose reductase
MKKILVLGASGMAGHTITLYFKEKGYDVTAYSITPFPFCRNINGDAFNREEFTQIIVQDDYDIVINCIGILNQVADENLAMAVYLNSYLPHLIADTLKSSKARLIHMSTDCVFAGNTGPYFENSLRDGHSFYDRSKALGEIDDEVNLTFRNSIIGPDMNDNGIGLFNWFMKQNKEFKGFTGALWTGVTTLTLAKAMESAIQENLSGLYNLVNNYSISKYELLSLFNKHFRNNCITIHRSDKLQLDKSLRNSRTDFSFVVPSYEQMIIEMKEWIEAHPQLYLHYNL